MRNFLCNLMKEKISPLKTSGLIFYKTRILHHLITTFFPFTT